MKKLLLLITGLLLITSNALALPFTGSIWNGKAADSYANNPISGPPSFQAAATFTIDNISFDSSRNGGTDTTYQKFLQGDALTNLNNLQWVTGSSVANSFYTSNSNGMHGSFFDIKGTSYFDSSVDVLHDDGFVLILKQNGITKYLFDKSTPVSPTLDELSLIAGFYDFEVRYGATNSFPEILTISGMSTSAPVPEPGTMMLLGFGLLSIAVYSKRKTNNI